MDRSITMVLPRALESAVATSLNNWRAHDKVGRLWQRDAGLWTGGDEGRWLGWLDVVDRQIAEIKDVQEAATGIRREGFSSVLLLGMGGSSLCPDVMRSTFGPIAGWPELHLLDSTVPAQVRAVERRLDLERTVVIVSSKSGSTLEPNIFLQHFYARMVEAVGEAQAGRQFVAITDPGSAMERVATDKKFRRIFHGTPSIGGRYSALSPFGVFPSAVMGLDVGRLLARAKEMVRRCGPDVAAFDNPGVLLGAVLGTAAHMGRDKVTIIASPGIESLGGWLEQLLAESTGKEGKGLVPVDGETPGPSSAYGTDRLFVYVRLESAANATTDHAVAVLEQEGQPVVRVHVADVYELGAEFFRWEIATAVAGSILGINPFDQPDVEASKVQTRELTSAYERTGSLPLERPFFEQDGLRLFSDEVNARALQGAVETRSLDEYLSAHFARLRPGDYAALLAYIEMSAAHVRRLQSIRHLLRDKTRAATCLGFGPRFLHSTGQAYKGGPNTGVFLQITCDDAVDVPVPGQKFTFGVVKAAQARGDLQVLFDRGRRALRVHLGPDVRAGLTQLEEAMRRALP